MKHLEGSHSHLGSSQLCIGRTTYRDSHYTVYLLCDSRRSHHLCTHCIEIREAQVPQNFACKGKEEALGNFEHGVDVVP